MHSSKVRVQLTSKATKADLTTAMRFDERLHTSAYDTCSRAIRKTP